MTSSGSSSYNPFAGPDPADLCDINIHDRVPVVLDTTDATYFAWKTYFSLLFRENNLVDHVDGSVDSRARVGDSEWTAIDATLIRWFFTTISKDLFHTVVSDGDNARAVWVKLNGLFTDNKLQRRVFLQQEFFDCHQDDQSIDDYCRRLKTLADELRDIGANVDDDPLLSMLTAGLNEDFGNAASNLSVIPEPSLPKFVAYLRLEERRMKGVKKRVQHHALAAGTSRGAPPPAATPAPAPCHQPAPPRTSGVLPPLARAPRPTRCPQQPQQGGGRRGNRSGGGRKQAQGGAPRQQQQQATPPCTYGTNPWTGVVHAYSMSVPRAPAPRILGPWPASHQALFTAQNATPCSGYGAAPALAYGGFIPPQVSPPWDPALLAALHSAPSPRSYGGGGDWYMDSGATAHMTAHPVINLVSVCRLARENPITVEFDNIGFSVKDAHTRMVLHRCDSPDELYPVHPSGAATTRRPAAFAAGVDLWHARLGHPNSTIMRTITLGVPRGAVCPCLHLWRTALLSTGLGPARAPGAGGPVAVAPSAAPVAAAPSAAPGAAAPPAAPDTPAPSAAPVTGSSSSSPVPLSAPPAAAAPLTGVVTRARTGAFRPSTRYTSDKYACAASTPAPSQLPTSVRAALRDLNWLAAMREEFDALQRNRTWQLVRRPPRANVITGKWVFRHKTHPDGSLERYKVRWVVPSFRQRAGVDFTDTFAPVVKLGTIRAVLQLAVSHAWPVHQLDVSNAFLHGHLDEQVFCQQPTGFVDTDHPEHVCLLSRSLYGLKQGTATAYLLLYVDDIILTASSPALLQQITARLGSEFSLKDLGSLHYFLGIEVVRGATRFFLHQQKHAYELLERVGMLNCKPAPTPVDTKAKVSAVEGSPASDAPLYRSIVGALQYLTLTRPDSMGLTLTASPDTSLVAYSDADWAECPDTRRSTSGYCVYLRPSLISWSSKRQPTVSRSSAEAEYRAVANAVAECSWLRQLLQELLCEVTKSTLVNCDNVSAVYLAANPVHHRRTKHIELDIHFVREHVALGRVRVLHVPTDQQFADRYQKPTIVEDMGTLLRPLRNCAGSGFSIGTMRQTQVEWLLGRFRVDGFIVHINMRQKYDMVAR
ncbi:uncharacterized protein [Aegilops tauschii subsp. strangulata]|uniref:uncharacterized protein n=1 Tax=Aegilops tauschii subsp. strangulata TaxID=200361 RepID=UPI003CC86897